MIISGTILVFFAIIFVIGINVYVIYQIITDFYAIWVVFFVAVIVIEIFLFSAIYVKYIGG